MAAELPVIGVLHIGHDSEFFLWDTKKEQVVPSYKYYPPREESKEFRPNKRRLKKRYTPPASGWSRPFVCRNGSGGKARIFRDGLAVEVNTSPVWCRAFMWNDTRQALLTGEPGRLKKDYVFTSRPWVEITEKMMADFPDDLKVLGCSPSLDAYKQRQKTVAVDPLKTFYRTSGAHLHMSWHGFSSEKPIPSDYWTPIIRSADQLLGLPHVIIFGDELERKRRKLYGQAGEFRAQSYGGLEYRSLSSRIWNHQGIYSYFLGMWKYLIGGKLHWLQDIIDPGMDPEVQQAINEVNVDLACELVGKIFTKLAEKAHLDYWSYAGPRPPGTICREGSWKNAGEIFKKLRELHLKGLIPDAGVWSRPFAPDGHQGWGEYSNQLLRDNYQDTYGKFA